MTTKTTKDTLTERQKPPFTNSQWSAAAEIAADLRQRGQSRWQVGDDVHFTRRSAYQRDNWISCIERCTPDVMALARAIASLDDWDILCSAKKERTAALERLRATRSGRLGDA